MGTNKSSDRLDQLKAANKAQILLKQHAAILTSTGLVDRAAIQCWPAAKTSAPLRELVPHKNPAAELSADILGADFVLSTINKNILVESLQLIKYLRANSECTVRYLVDSTTVEFHCSLHGAIETVLPVLYENSITQMALRTTSQANRLCILFDQYDGVCEPGPIQVQHDVPVYTINVYMSTP